MTWRRPVFLYRRGWKPSSGLGGSASHERPTDGLTTATVIDIARLAALADGLRARHNGPEALVLPNAWDAASARAVVDAGFPVVATTSSGIAASLGWADGEKAPQDEMFE